MAVKEKAGDAGELLVEVPVSEITVGEQQVRHSPNDDDIVELAADIASRGLLQPIGVTRTGPHAYQLRFGSRRLTAHIRLRRATVLARVFTSPDVSIKGTALAENIHRREMTLQEEVDAVDYLYATEKRSPDEICGLLSKGRSWVNRRLAFKHLPADVGRACVEGGISLAAAEILGGLEDASARAYILSQAIGAKYNVAQVRAMVEAFQAAPDISTAIEAGVAAAASQQVQQQVMLRCATCTRPSDPAQMVMVRLCPGCVEVINSPEVQSALAGVEAPVVKAPGSAEQ